MMNNKQQLVRKPIGLFGGTFDPVHYGHLRTALEIYQSLELEELRFIPCRQPVHKSLAQASPGQRLDMLKLAIADQPGFSIDTRELERQTPSYSIDTLLSLRQELGDEQPLCFIIGSDAYQQWHTWHRWQEIITLTHLIVIPRPNFQLPKAGLLTQHHVTDAKILHTTAAGSVFIQAVTPLAISSTTIRQQLAQQKNVRYLLPDNVYNYIQHHAILGTKSII